MPKRLHRLCLRHVTHLNAVSKFNVHARYRAPRSIDARIGRLEGLRGGLLVAPRDDGAVNFLRGIWWIATTLLCLCC